VFAAYIKLLIPFIIVIPGIIAWLLYADELQRSDMAYPLLLQRLLPGGLTGLMFAALLAAIMSSLDSMLNSAATIFTIDLYQRWMRPDSSQQRLITVGRLSTVLFLIIAAAWSPFLLRFERVFSYIQEFWGLITPGVAVVFLGGLFWRHATAPAAATVMAATLPVTIGVKLIAPSIAFLDQMWIAALLLAMLLVATTRMTRIRAASFPAETASVEIQRPERDLLFDLLCAGVIVSTGLLYWLFF
jgi:SSS family solute:Na+ symporter